MDVSVCLPVRNEKALRATVLEIKAALDRLPYKYEIIVVDDGSTDNCIDTIMDLDVRILRHRRCFGGGVARVTAMRHAQGRIILQSDADGTYPCDKLGEMLKRMESAAMVIGARKSESARDWRPLRVLMKWLMRSLASAIAGHHIPDLNSGLRAYDRRLAMRYEYLFPKGHSIMSTITLAFLTEDLVVDFVEIDYRERVGKSSFHPLHDTLNYLISTIRVIATFDPLRLLLPLGVVLFVLSVALVTRDLILFYRLGNVSPILCISTLLVMITGMIADQVSRLSRQVAQLTNRHIVEEEDLIYVKGGPATGAGRAPALSRLGEQSAPEEKNRKEPEGGS